MEFSYVGLMAGFNIYFDAIKFKFKKIIFLLYLLSTDPLLFLKPKNKITMGLAHP